MNTKALFGNKRIVLALGMIVFVAAVVAGGTGAFFSDTETSTGNTFTAGAIDLTIDNVSYYNGNRNEGTTWLDAKDLDEGTLFFNFDDLKPGDVGEDTISLHVNNNDAYLCMDVSLDETLENGQTEPEENDEGVDQDGIGELQNEINFVWWNDDGDNVLEVGDEAASAQVISLAEMNDWTLPISDTSNDSLFDGPIPGDSVQYIAKAWCFGDLELTPADEGDNDPTQVSGVTCNGVNLDNTTQTDSVEGTISFYAVQARNNDQFVCEPHLESGNQ